jgi:hypothetical protein
VDKEREDERNASGSNSPIAIAEKRDREMLTSLEPLPTGREVPEDGWYGVVERMRQVAGVRMP